MDESEAGTIDLRGQVAMVTGGGRGLGRAFALALAGVGAAVAIIARSPDELAETAALMEQAGRKFASYVADITDTDAITRIVATIENSLGPIDLLVNNAGVIGPLGPFVQSPVEDWWRTLDINLRGQALCAHRVLPGMMVRGRGRIINIASGGGATMFPYFSAYITSKTALIRFAECLAHETRPHGIAVFAMGPGTVRTRMSEYSLSSPEGRAWLPWFRDIFDQGRDLPPERPASLLLTLASGRADRLSGHYIVPGDDVDRMIAAAADIEAQSLYSLQVRRLG